MILAKIFSIEKGVNYIEDYWTDIIPRRGDILSIDIENTGKAFTVDHVAHIIRPMETNSKNNRLSCVEVFVRDYIKEIDGNY